MVNTFDIGTALKKAVQLDLHPIYIIGSNTTPDSSVPLTSIDRCIAKVMFLLARHSNVPTLFLNAEQVSTGCPGGMSHCGFCKANPMIKYFVSTGTPEYRDGLAEYLRANPEIAEESDARAGKFTPPKKNLIFATEDKIAELSLDASDVLAITCFGTAEQIRNLSALVHFRNTDIFQNVIGAVGPACSTFISYPAGLSENAPKNSVYIGPTDPTVNKWLPPEFMALGIPISLAQQMADDLPASFLTLRPQVASPSERTELTYSLPK